MFHTVLQNEMQTSMLIVCQQMNGQLLRNTKQDIVDCMEYNIIFDKSTNCVCGSGTVAAVETTAAGMFAISGPSTPTSQDIKSCYNRERYQV